MEDIIEEIVGDIQDEFDNETEEILEVGDSVYLCDARANLADVNEALGTQLPEEDFDTLGGFVFDLFGKIPVTFEKARFEDLDFIVQEMEGHKIRTVKVMVGQPSAASPQEGRERG
jgi:CBS domain containing-hemolysin-like protein